MFFIVNGLIVTGILILIAALYPVWKLIQELDKSPLKQW